VGGGRNRACDLNYTLHVLSDLNSKKVAVGVHLEKLSWKKVAVIFLSLGTPITFANRGVLWAGNLVSAKI
jgi:hypothetical protein